MARSVDFLIDADQPMADFANELNTLLDIELQPAIVDGKAYYAFRAMTLTLDLYEVAGATGVGKDEDYRYHVSINGIFGSELQRKKWTTDWSHSIVQTLKAHEYRLKRVDPL